MFDKQAWASVLISQQRSARIAGQVIAWGSAFLTFAFGFGMCHDGSLLMAIMGVVWGSVLAVLSFQAVKLLSWSYFAHINNMPRIAWGIFGLWVVCWMADSLSNQAVTVSLRDMRTAQVTHTNGQVSDNRDAVNGAKSKLAAYQTEMQGLAAQGLTEPGVFSAEVRGLKATVDERGRNIFQRSSNCQNATVKSSQDLCQAIATAELRHSKATRYQTLEVLVGQQEATVQTALARNEDLPPAADFGRSQMLHFASIGTQEVTPTSDAEFWTNKVIIGLLSMVIVLIGAVLHLFGVVDLSGLIGDDDAGSAKTRKYEEIAGRLAKTATPRSEVSVVTFDHFDRAYRRVAGSSQAVA